MSPVVVHCLPGEVMHQEALWEEDQVVEGGDALDHVLLGNPGSRSSCGGQFETWVNIAAEQVHPFMASFSPAVQHTLFRMRESSGCCPGLQIPQISICGMFWKKSDPHQLHLITDLKNLLLLDQAPQGPAEVCRGGNGGPTDFG